MTKKRKTKEEQKLAKAHLIIGICCGIVGLGLVIGIAIGVASSSGKLKLSDSEKTLAIFAVAMSAKSALNGSGTLSVDNCNDLKALAEKKVPDTDWFDNYTCTDGHVMRTKYVSTADTVQLKFFDDGFCATYIFDSEQEYLLDFTFEESSERGYYLTIEED